MIEIVDFKRGLHQWDVNRTVRITDIDADKIHVANIGDSKAAILDIVNSEAKIPNFLLQTGKQVCVYAVKNGVTIESKIFYVMNRERPENYVYEDDQRNYIYELISDAERAIQNANEAADRANKAAENAGGSGGGGTDISNLKIGETLKIEDGVLSVNTTNDMEQDNTLPITSAGVFATVGNIEALLRTI